MIKQSTEELGEEGGSLLGGPPKVSRLQFRHIGVGSDSQVQVALGNMRGEEMYYSCSPQSLDSWLPASATATIQNHYLIPGPERLRTSSCFSCRSKQVYALYLCIKCLQMSHFWLLTCPSLLSVAMIPQPKAT